ncbi:MAG: hypothetical protein IMZ66_08590, partial [Planctomycetes bacterium]|nr:hypothetical protein [Planctomycetota bacterium]
MVKRESAACGARSGEHWRASRQWHPAFGEHWRARTGLRCARTSRHWYPASALLAVLAGLAALAAAGCRREPVELVEMRQAMDTEVMVRAVAPSEAVARRALAMAWEEMDLCAAKLDRYRKPSAGWLSEDAT